jgi:hypothetical protein
LSVFFYTPIIIRIKNPRIIVSGNGFDSGQNTPTDFNKKWQNSDGKCVRRYKDIFTKFTQQRRLLLKTSLPGRLTLCVRRFNNGVRKETRCLIS